jgi:hypothetical protein
MLSKQTNLYEPLVNGGLNYKDPKVAKYLGR